LISKNSGYALIEVGSHFALEIARFNF